MSTSAITISDGAISGNWQAITSSTYSTGAGTTVNLVYQGTPEMVTPDQVAYKGTTEDTKVSTRGKKKVRGSKENEPIGGKYTSTYRLGEVNPKIYFKFVKSKLSKIELDTLKKLLNKIRPLLVQAEEMKQRALFEALSTQLAIMVREQEAFAIGHEKRIHRKHIEMFMKKIEGRCVKFEPLEKFPRVIPAQVRAKIKKVQDAGVFDEFHLLYIDHTGEELKTNKQKIKEKDPILFGRFNFQPDVFYFIIDWIDKYCDLTLSKLIDELQIDDPEFELDLLPELDEAYVQAIMQDVNERADRLNNTKPSNFRQLMEEEDKAKETKNIPAKKKDKTLLEKAADVVRYPFGKPAKDK